MPTSAELYERLIALFDAGDDDAVTLQSLASQEIGHEGLVVRLDFNGREDQGAPQSRLEAWLDQPNPAFDGVPRDYLNGDEQRLCYLAAVIGALEQGVFF